jgi:8-oxo-dGTP pyrophosphatase MutT (NUDIX family)
VVFVPLPRDGNWVEGYEAQVEWELEYLNMADAVVFWVPRSADLPGFTTNVEYGMYFDSGKAILGYPEGATHMRYLAHHAYEESVPVYGTLMDTLRAAVTRICALGALRTGGERCVPLHIWKLPHFQGWLQAQKAAGNRLDGARLLWSFRVGPTKTFTLAYAMRVNIYVAAEGRNKSNEFLVSRTDLSACVLHRGNQIVLVREFRSPVRNERGFMYDLAGGSSWKHEENPIEVISHEVEEEVGIKIDPGRFVQHKTRQVAASFSTHVVHLFSAELTADEINHLTSHAGEVHGVLGDTERTYAEVWGIQDICDQQLVDWSTLGMILSVVRPA